MLADRSSITALRSGSPIGFAYAETTRAALTSGCSAIRARRSRILGSSGGVGRPCDSLDMACSPRCPDFMCTTGSRCCLSFFAGESAVEFHDRRAFLKSFLIEEVLGLCFANTLTGDKWGRVGLPDIRGKTSTFTLWLIRGQLGTCQQPGGGGHRHRRRLSMSVPECPRVVPAPLAWSM